MPLFQLYITAIILVIFSPWVVSCGEPSFISVSRHKCSIVYVRVCVVHCERLLVIHVLGSTNCSQLYNVN